MRILIFLFLCIVLINPVSANACTYTSPLNLTTATEVDPGNQLSLIYPNSSIHTAPQTTETSKVYKTLTRNITSFNLSFDMLVSTAVASSAFAPFSLSDTTTNAKWQSNAWGTANGVGLLYTATLGVAPNKAIGGVQTQGTYIAVTTGTRYYFNVTKNSTYINLSIYTTMARTTHVAGSPQSLSITDSSFDILQFASNVDDFGVGSRAYQIDNISLPITENVSSCVPIYASDTLRYSNDTENSTFLTYPVKLSELTISENYTGSWKINYTIKCDAFGSFQQIYRNNVTYGTLQSPASCGWMTYYITSETFTGTILSGDKIQIYGYSPGGVAYEKDFRILFDYDYTNTTPVLTYPVNGSTISFNFPPQFADVNFTWEEISGSGYQIQVAKDIDFNLIAWDVTSTTFTKTLPLEADVWYWRVRTYNNGTAGNNWSSISSFTFSETASSVSGTNVNGVVFEYIGGVQTPITGASVYLTNATTTKTALTGSNGYFLFDNLENTTYSLYSIKQGYDNSQVFAVLPITNATTTVNLPMRIYISPYVPNFVFEKFIIRDMFDNPYVGVTINIYVGSSLSPSFTGTTDSMGQIVFQLVKDTYYRIELSGGGLPSIPAQYFYGKEETYLITITSGFPDGGDKFDDVNATLYVTELNATHANLSLYYSDNSSTTSIINFYARYYGNGTSVCNGAVNSTTYPITLNCTVYMGNNVYLFGWNATSSKYGTMQGADVVNFAAHNTSAPQAIGTTMSTSMLNWVSILSLIFVAGLFSVRSVKFGVVVVPFIAEIFYWAGTLQINSIIVHTALVLGVLAYLRMSEQKVIA